MNLIPLLSQAAAKLGILGQEPVSRVDGVGAALLGRADDLLDVEIALRGRRRADEHSLVGQLGEERLPVGLGEDGDGRNAQLAAGPYHPDGDLSAIGDEDLLDHLSPPCQPTISADHQEDVVGFEHLALLRPDLLHHSLPRRARCTGASS